MSSLPNNSVIPERRAAGFWDLIAQAIRQLFGMGSAGASVAGSRDVNELVEEAEAEENFIIAPGGYRIRIPGPGDVAGQVGEVLPDVKEALSLVPPLPRVVTELLAEVQNANSTASSAATIAASDPALAGALLRTVNSSAFGLTRKITSVTEAISYLGFGMVKSIVVRLRLGETLKASSPQAAIDSEDLWIHSLAVSYVADALAERVPGIDRGFISTLGLMHDIGRVAINAKFHERVKCIHSAGECGSLLEREAKVFGTDHAHLGAFVANRWGLPGDLVNAIRWHHDPARAFGDTDPLPLRKAVRVVQVANQLAKYGYAYADNMEIDAIAPQTLEMLGLPGSLDQLMDDRIRNAIGRAVLFAADDAGKAPLTVRRHLRLRRGDEARQLVANCAAPANRITISNERVTALLPETSQAMELTSTPGKDLPPHIMAMSCKDGLARVLAGIQNQQEKLSAPDKTKTAVRFVARSLLANLLRPAADARPVEIFQTVENNHLVLVVRSADLAFAERLGEAGDAGRKLVEAELGNILNLGWFESITLSSDGATWVFEAP